MFVTTHQCICSVWKW